MKWDTDRQRILTNRLYRLGQTDTDRYTDRPIPTDLDHRQTAMDIPTDRQFWTNRFRQTVTDSYRQTNTDRFEQTDSGGLRSARGQFQREQARTSSG